MEVRAGVSLFRSIENWYTPIASVKFEPNKQNFIDSLIESQYVHNIIISH